MKSDQSEQWDFPGWGSAERITDLAPSPRDFSSVNQPPIRKLGPWKATAICGNDIASSCLYVTAISTLYAGQYAPLSLIIVAAVLYLYRAVYAEVGTALPLNGGAYNVLLNTTSKSKASAAACLTLLSYIATAVISASAAMSYAHSLFPVINVIPSTIAVLAVFAVLSIIGIGESANRLRQLLSYSLCTLEL